MKILISCKGAGELPLTDLKQIQGDFKTLDKESYETLKREILQDGFSFPVAVWENEKSEFLIIDGHQRVKTLEKMKAEGYIVPQVPVVFIEAKNLSQAKHKLLAAASRYGTVQNEGFKEFLKDVDFNYEDIIANFKFPELDLQQFIKEVTYNVPDPLDMDQVIIGEGVAPIATPPKVESQPNSAEPGEPQAQIRMVQLFFNGETHKEFLQIVASLQKKLEINNVTDLVLEVMRERNNSKSKQKN